MDDLQAKFVHSHPSGALPPLRSPAEDAADGLQARGAILTLERLRQAEMGSKPGPPSEGITRPAANHYSFALREGAAPHYMPATVPPVAGDAAVLLEASLSTTRQSSSVQLRASGLSRSSSAKQMAEVPEDDAAAAAPAIAAPDDAPNMSGSALLNNAHVRRVESGLAPHPRARPFGQQWHAPLPLQQERIRYGQNYAVRWRAARDSVPRRPHGAAAASASVVSCRGAPLDMDRFVHADIGLPPSVVATGYEDRGCCPHRMTTALPNHLGGAAISMSMSAPAARDAAADAEQRARGEFEASLALQRDADDAAEALGARRAAQARARRLSPPPA